MRERLLDLLACSQCESELVLAKAETVASEHIIEGKLACSSCQEITLITKGVPRFVKGLDSEGEKTAENFGWQWNEFTQEDEKYKDQLLGWLQPVESQFFQGKVILEGGCGKGRHTRLAHEWGAKEIVGVDLSSAVDTAFEATCELPNAHIVQADIFNLPLKRQFDYAFSVGVLHHTEDPKNAFISLANRVKRDGHVSAWVYGAENNGWITKLVDPVRKGITSKLSKPVLFQLSKLPTLSAFSASRFFYRPLNSVVPKVAEKLFYNTYMNGLADFGWREQHNIVFDHLVAPTAYYISKDDFEDWWTEVSATDLKIIWHNQNSWCGFGKLS